MDFDCFHQLLSRITYKPGFEMEFFDGAAVVRASAKVIDIVDQVSTVTLGMFAPVNPYSIFTWDEQQALEFVKENVLLNFEMHELSEWFKVDGQHVISPHGGPVYVPKKSPYASPVIREVRFS